MADLSVQERQHVAADAQQGRVVPRRRKEKDFCDLLVKIVIVAASFFISLAAFAFLPVEQAIVVTALVAVAALLYLFRNVERRTSPSGYHQPAYTHHRHDVWMSDPLIFGSRGGFNSNSFSSNYGGSMSYPVGFGAKNVTSRQGDEGKAGNPSNKREEGKMATPSSGGNAGLSGIGGGRSSIGGTAGKSGFGASGSSVPSSSGSGKSGFGSSPSAFISPKSGKSQFGSGT